MLRYIVPLVAFLGVCVFLYLGLDLKPREVPSPFINKPAPTFSLQKLHEPETHFSTNDMLGKVWLLNVWASWCTSCRAEHHVLNTMVNNNKVNLLGLNYKDEVADARGWLVRYGDPYQLSVSDLEGLAGIDWGVYGVPETFFIDKKGIIRYKHIGPISYKDLTDIIIPLIKELKAEK